MWFTFSVLFVVIQSICALVDITIDQKLENAGFHRLLVTNITLYANLTSCNLLLEEKFPKNFYIADSELENINQFSEVNLKLSHKLNVETAASESVPFSAFIFLNKSQPVVTSTEFRTNYLYSIPLRVRYHDPKTEGGVREFKKPPVILYGRCPSGLSVPKGTVAKLLCDPYTSETCEWTTLSFTQKSLLPQILIPVGDTNHYPYAFVSTHVSAYVGLFYLLCSLFIRS